jgi:hypothetical protein
MGHDPASAHRARRKGGADRGELTTESDWVTSTGTVLLHERTQFFFSGDATTRTDRSDRDADGCRSESGVRRRQDGMLGMRVARQLEQPSNEPLVFTDIAGRATEVPKMDNTGVTGEYLSSEGRKATRCGRRAGGGRCSPARSANSRSRSR